VAHSFHLHIQARLNFIKLRNFYCRSVSIIATVPVVNMINVLHVVITVTMVFTFL